VRRNKKRDSLIFQARSIPLEHCSVIVVAMGTKLLFNAANELLHKLGGVRVGAVSE